MCAGWRHRSSARRRPRTGGAGAGAGAACATTGAATGAASAAALAGVMAATSAGMAVAAGTFARELGRMPAIDAAPTRHRTVTEMAAPAIKGWMRLAVVVVFMGSPGGKVLRLCC